MEQEKAQTYEDLNHKLQNVIVEATNERKVISEQMAESSQSIAMDHKKQFVPIGTYRASNNTIHIGRNKWISFPSYNNILINSQSPSVFVGNTLMAVYGESTLIESTKSGRQSNKSIGKLKNKDSNTVNNEKPKKLDTVKLQACYDFYAHWLTTEYTPKNGEKGSGYFDEIDKFNTYVSLRVAYLKKGRRQKKGAQKKTKHTEEETPINDSEVQDNSEGAQKKTKQHREEESPRKNSELEDNSEEKDVRHATSNISKAIYFENVLDESDNRSFSSIDDNAYYSDPLAPDTE